MSFTGSEGGFISLNDGADLTATYRTEFPNGVKGHFFGKDKLQDLLDQTGAMGIRFYQGMDTTGAFKLVAVAADSSTDDILDAMNPLILDQAVECPSTCGANNDLNS